MTDTEHRAMCTLGERMHAGEDLTETEFDEYRNLAALGVQVPAAK